MELFTKEAARLGESTRRISRSLKAFGESRLELFLLELREERDHFVRSLIIALGIFAFALLGMAALTASVVIGLRSYSPVLVLGWFAGLYGFFALALSFVLWRTIRRAEPFSASFDQLRKDHSSFERLFS